MTNPFRVKDLVIDGTATIGGVAIGGGSGGGITNSAGTNVIMKSDGANSVASTMTDDGTAVRIPLLSHGYTDVGTLAAGTVDLDLSAVPTMFVVFTPNINGTYIRSIRPANATGGEMRVLWNNGNSVNPSDYCAAFTQDDGGSLYSRIHLAGRQPWYVLPALSMTTLRMGESALTSSKWFLQQPLDYSLHPRPIPITITLSTGNKNDLTPVDDTSGFDGRYASWWRLVPSSGTRITGINSVITAGSNWSRRILLSNYSGNNLVIAHANSTGGTSTYSMLCPGSADFTIRPFGSVWVIYDEANHKWLVEGA